MGHPHDANSHAEIFRRLAVIPREASPPGDVRWAAVSILFHEPHPGELSVLFIKRASRERDPWSGHMAFPGGRHDPTDADLLATALRETREEVGLNLDAPVRMLGRLNDMQAYSRSQPIPLFIRPFIFHWQGEHPDHRPEPAPNYEVEKTVWIPLKALLEKAHHGTMPWHRDNQTLHLPCIRYQEYVVWGLTYYMVKELLERLEEVSAPESQP